MKLDSPVLGVGPLAADRLEQANINPTTGLATDYLNHFNEVMMLLEMLPAMPECAEDVLDWHPIDYEDHFETSGFSDKKLAVDAYHAAPVRLRTHLEAYVAEINAVVLLAQEQIRATEDLASSAIMIADTATSQIKPLISKASGVIHGHLGADALQSEGEEAQAEIDAMFA
ncbi:hypothetical protein J0X15_09745 [Roseibium sp. CAU 1637]|uniref:Uncharacterized protein n=1 Tax=Roseibium limicola TaxID=2816037 RepID=A0A939J6V3_9HYPH|nr:hypothetical protein [Roseibium limicola]MBO0345502.1 hypothetical protein [Roseibium limicola]